VIDDGSEDATLNVLRSYQKQDDRIHYYERKRAPKGAPTCRNIGLKYAKGDYIIFLDSDDCLLPFCLERRIEMFAQYPECDFLVFPMGIKHKNGIVKKEMLTDQSFLIEFLSANLPWSIMCPIWRKSKLIGLNGFTEGYPRFNDPELMIRALLKKDIVFKVFNKLDYDTVYVPSPKNENLFIEKVYKSMILFIPDICNAMQINTNVKNKKHLSNYLHLWFKYFYVPLRNNEMKRSLHLIVLFYREGIISLSKFLSLLLRLFLFVGTNLFLKEPIIKLTDKSFYN